MPAGGPVAGHGQGAALAALPGLQQRVGEQRQGAGVVLDLAHQQVDQAGLDQQARLPGRALDRLAQIALLEPPTR